MHITKLILQNFKSYETFELDFTSGKNIICGNNEAGKSTILEAIHLALTGAIGSIAPSSSVSSHLFNNEAVRKYVESLLSDRPSTPPSILIEVHFSEKESPMGAKLSGNGNSKKNDACGILLSIEFNDEYQSEYNELVRFNKLITIPTEYYRVRRESFARKAITSKSIPVSSYFLDAMSSRPSIIDKDLNRLIKNALESSERIQIQQDYRSSIESFKSTETLTNLNHKFDHHNLFTNKELSLSIPQTGDTPWDELVFLFDGIPLTYIGKGEQTIIKTAIALNNIKTDKPRIILMEEPENHLSFSKLNQFVHNIEKLIADNTPENISSQLILTTHSSFIANKLDLHNMIILSDKKTLRLDSLTSDTKIFFKKLPGYDLLRCILSKAAILVEGSSDELIVQKAYMQQHDGKLPIEDGIDIISVGIAFLRYLEIAHILKLNVAVVTDNDGNVAALEKKYKGYENDDTIAICYDSIEHSQDQSLSDYNNNTLEPAILRANGLQKLLSVLELSNEKTESDLKKWMKNNKTEFALKIFETTDQINFPEYIMNAIQHVSKK